MVLGDFDKALAIHLPFVHWLQYFTNTPWVHASGLKKDKGHILLSPSNVEAIEGRILNVINTFLTVESICAYLQ